MDVIYRCCAGIDVHKKLIAVNLLRRGVESRADLDEVRTFSTMTRDRMALADWLKSEGCTHIAVESTGVYWKPIYNILEAEFTIILVNARHIKAVPGRKTDVADCRWIAQLLQHGLLKASFIPPAPIREIRDLTRERRKLIQSRATVTNRIAKVLEDANIKLASVASNIVGASGLEMLHAIIDHEEDVEKLANMAKRQLRSKREQLKEALYGRVTDHHRFLLSQHLRQLRFLDEEIREFDLRIERLMRPFSLELSLLVTIPGVGRRTAEQLLGEIGAEMDRFPSDRHISSWAGVCSGNNESAGKRKGGQTTQGNKWVKSTLTEAAWAVSRTKDTYLAARYRRLAARRGKKRAIMAVGHSILVIAYHILKEKHPYRELGADFLDQQHAERVKSRLVKRLQGLGYDVAVWRKPAA